jgi:FlaA1/EpsC-like NDP-sugar epimerase
MNRERFHLRNRYIFALDLGLMILSVVLSFVIRLSLFQVQYDYPLTLLVMLGTALVVKPLVYQKFGLYQQFWMYASIRELNLITRAVTVASLIVGGIQYLLNFLGVFEYFARSVPIIDWMISLILVGGIRFLPRLLTEADVARQSHKGEGRVLVVGAGDAGALVVREFQKNPQLKLTPVAFLDDDRQKQGVRIHDVPVVGTLDDLTATVESKPISEVVIAIPSAPGVVVRKVAEVCREKRIPFRTMPGIYELLGGVVSVNRLREVELADLLRREHATINPERIERLIEGKRILVTGAGGSIASELCRQVARWSPAELILVGHGENSIYEIMIELEQTFPNLSLFPIIADVRDRTRLEHVFERFKPEVVFHAAAHKHVPLMEKNVEEAITNNVLGTRNLVDVASASGTQRLVMISTDKAVRPTSVMGATKRLAEMIVLNAGKEQQRHFSVVRFGNVLGSRGSVVPRFKRQIAVGGPVTVTHPEMERFFMTIPEAVHLVLQAFAMGEGGEVFLLNMGNQVKILDLVNDLIRLSGLEPVEDIEIVFTGMRPGEKMKEELWDEGIHHHATDHPDVTRIDENELLDARALDQLLDQLLVYVANGNVEQMVEELDNVIPGSRIRETPTPDLTSIV